MKIFNKWEINKIKNSVGNDMTEWYKLADFLGLDKNMSKDTRSEATYFACLKILSEAVGKLPLKLLRKTTKDGVIEATNHPLFNVVRNRPNRYMTSTTFWSTNEYYRNHYGNSVSLIVGYGTNLQLVPLDYSRLQIWYDDGKLLSEVPDVWYLYDIGGTTYKLSSEEVLHFKTSITEDGIKGESVREMLKMTIEGNQKAQNIQNALFDNGFTSKVVVQYTGNLNDENTKKFLQNIESYAKGKVDVGKGLIPIPLGTTLTPLNTKLADNEFMELKKYGALQIAAAFGIKPVQINDYSKSSYSSSENQNLAFLVDTLLFILKQYEEELNWKLLSEEEIKNGYFFKFNIGMLLRADMKTQIESITKAISNGLYTPNEGRAYLDLPSKEGGDSLIVNGSMIRVEQVGTQYGVEKINNVSNGLKRPLDINVDNEGGDEE